MNKVFTAKQVWFMRHGNPTFDYENCTYDEFIEMLSNGSQTPLADDHGIDFASLPQNVKLICHSAARRAVETAKKLQEHLNIEAVELMNALDEIKFDKDVILRHEYESIKSSRPVILTRWFNNENKLESFEDSKARVRKIEEFLQTRREKSIICVTHGLFLRLLELYFVQGKRKGITLSDLLKVKPIELGQFIEVRLKPESRTESNIHATEALSAKQKRKVRF